MADRSIEIIGTGSDLLALVETVMSIPAHDGSLGTSTETALLHGDVEPLVLLHDAPSRPALDTPNSIPALLHGDVEPLVPLRDTTSAGAPTSISAADSALLHGDVEPLVPLRDASSARIPLAPNDPTMTAANQGIVKLTVFNS